LKVIVFLGTILWVDEEEASQQGIFFGVDLGKKMLVH
jgi:hypothetical protein